MTDPIRIYRLWRTSGIMCTLGALEFGYLAYVRQTWWPLIVTALLLVVAGLAFRRIRAPR
jgi:hypothetical protein